MNRFNPRFALAGALIAIGVMSATSASAQTSIRDTRHNLSSTAPVGVTITDRNMTSATDQICVFCHTPHGASTSGNGPLWNRSASTGSYTTYGTTLGGIGTSGPQTALTTVASVSLACLSCHDGTQALDAVLNAPGSGSTWASTPTWTRGAGAGDATLQGARNLGQDLSNDHPIGIQYANLTNANNEGYKAVQTSGTGASQIWWVDGGAAGSGTREKTDMILFARDFSGTNAPSVECATCHDVHGYQNAMFLRQPPAGSAICLTCHIK